MNEDRERVEAAIEQARRQRQVWRWVFPLIFAVPILVNVLAETPGYELLAQAIGGFIIYGGIIAWTFWRMHGCPDITKW